MTTPIVILVTQEPNHPLAELAIRYARSALAKTQETNTKEPPVKQAQKSHQPRQQQSVTVFFYAEGASTANALRWQTAEQINVCKQWQALASQYQLDLRVCVSTALARGVTDAENSQRHQLTGANLAEGFRLVGLSELVMQMNTHKVIQF